MGAAHGRMQAKAEEGDHEQCDGTDKRCRNFCNKCNVLCTCPCCRGRGIIALSSMVFVFIVLGLIIWYSNWYQKPIETLRGYFKEYRRSMNAEPIIKNNSS